LQRRGFGRYGYGFARIADLQLRVYACADVNLDLNSVLNKVFESWHLHFNAIDPGNEVWEAKDSTIARLHGSEFVGAQICKLYIGTGDRCVTGISNRSHDSSESDLRDGTGAEKRN
jgi:hypothetical protein